MKRRQLTLFVPAGIAEPIEAVRRVVDPVQHKLIPAHVTLCREDELEAFPGWRDRVASAVPRLLPLTLRFGLTVPFDGHGLMLPCLEGIESFRDLRCMILGSDAIRDSQPHLTLAHPRNPKSAGNAIEAMCDLPSAFEINFDRICLIEQVDSQPWNVIESFAAMLAIETRETE